MKVTAVAVVLAACCALTAGKEETADKEKRGAVSYTTPKPYATATAASAADVAYVTAKVSPQTFAPSSKEFAQPQYQVKYVQAAQHQQSSPVQYQYDYEQQPYSAQQQQQVTKLAPAKVAYAPAPVHFSLASDVSSFSYSSPLVSYSNLGLLKQTIGKVVEQSVAEPSYTQPQVHAQQYTSDSKVQYAPHQYVSYTKQPQKVVLQAAPAPQKVTYVAAPAPVPQKVQYGPVPQRVSYAQAQPQQQYKTVPTVVYASSPEEAYEKAYGKAYEKVNYVPQQAVYQEAAPQHQQHVAYQQAQPQQVQYVKLTPQQLAAYTQQLQQHQQQAHQAQPQYVEAQHSQQYSAAHSEQQPQYISHPQYYETKYSTPGVTYAQHQQQQ